MEIKTHGQVDVCTYSSPCGSPMDSVNKEKAAMVTPDRLHEFNTTPFGLCNAPATFELFMDRILRSPRGGCICADSTMSFFDVNYTNTICV